MINLKRLSLKTTIILKHFSQSNTRLDEGEAFRTQFD